MNQGPPVWRSMLFVPAHIEKYVAAAHRRGADACILDLEDSVPPAEKTCARTALAAAAIRISRSEAAVLVRINGEPSLIDDDLEAAVAPGIAALMVPKVESAECLRGIGRQIAELERRRGMSPGQTRLIAQIEHLRALPLLDEIATSTPRLLGMTLGSEDFSVSAGMRPTPEALYGPNQQLLFACRRAGLLPFGFPGSIQIFRDLELFRLIVGRARDMGFVGACAIHPDQVPVLNQVFTPEDDAVEQARALLEAGARALAQGRAAFEFRGRMVDPPVVAQAEEILRRHAALNRLPPSS